jgi:phospholipase C
MALADIDTIVIAMMENRSFDHMLGYLSLDETPDKLPVDGLSADPAWRAAFANRHAGISYEVKALSGTQRIDDPPHGYASIAMQIDTPAAGAPGMGGFVASYETFSDAKKPPPADLGAVMGYYDAAAVPTFDFLARNYCVCDRWFAALPLGTQANRLMAMAGESKILNNAGFPLPDHKLVYEWLDEKKIKWCAYQWGGYFPFFTLMGKWFSKILSSLTLNGMGLKDSARFRRYSRFAKDWASTKHAMPNVIFVEPEYGDGPHSKPNDDHPPTGVGPGQAMLKDLYKLLSGNSQRWAKTLLIITYDEHGGFFDHVPPIALDTIVADTHLKTTGVRVPALLVSPHVGAGSVFHAPLDHTSILQLLADRFAGGAAYSPAVAARTPPLARIGDALLATPRTGPAPAFPQSFTTVIATAVRALAARVTSAFAGDTAAATSAPAAPDTPNSEALDEAARRFAAEHPELASQKGWEQLRAYLATNPPPEPEPILQK